MKLMKVIEAYSKLISTETGAAQALRIQKESIDAILKGVGSQEWRTYMSNFHSNAEQLGRLCGEDKVFMTNSSWGPAILAYIVGSGVCGGTTTMTGVVDMPDPLKTELDNGLTETIDPANSAQIPPELEPYL